MHVEDAALERVMGHLARQSLDRQDLKGALNEIVGALPELFGVDGAGVLLIDEEHVLRYVASTDDDARLLEAVQEHAGRGPCVQALIEDTTVTVTDLLTDERWPDLGLMLAPQGVRAVLGMPVRVAAATVGSLNVYKRSAYAWDDSDRAALSGFNQLVDRLISAAVLSESHEALVTQLQHALHARIEIERAIGIVMALEQLDAPHAFERIRRTARSSRRAVHEIATEVISRRGLAGS